MPSLAFPLICALLRGESPAWPADAGDTAIEAFLRDARYHGVTPLLDARFRSSASNAVSPVPGAGSRVDDAGRTGSTTHWPDAILRACHEDALVQAVHEHQRRTELVRVLSAFAASGITPLLFKGSALAYTHYATPALRPRADSDILVAPQDRGAALALLRELGYRRTSGPASTYVGYQTSTTRIDLHGNAWGIDLHWRLSNAQSFAWLFTFEELAAASVPIDALGPNARGLGEAHALAIALLHRAAGNALVEPGSGDRLIWLHDFRVLADAMDDHALARFVGLAGEKRFAAIAIEGLRQCAGSMPSAHLHTLIASLERSPMATSGAGFLRAGRLRREWLELRAVPTMRARLACLAGRVLPDASYMRERFPDAQGRALPLLHAQRWFGRLVPRRSARER